MMVPSVAMSIHAGWAGTPNARHDLPVLSQSSLTVDTLVRERNRWANLKSSCVPRPMTLIFARFCRANCSTPGASPMHALQCGAQNQTSIGLVPSKVEASATCLPVFTSVTLMTGRGLFTTFAAADFVVVAVAAPAAPAFTIGDMKATSATVTVAVRTARRIGG